MLLQLVAQSTQSMNTKTSNKVQAVLSISELCIVWRVCLPYFLSCALLYETKPGPDSKIQLVKLVLCTFRPLAHTSSLY